ncbi:MAG: hypothetical protein AAB048_00520, partial [Planctomycetota bacterium]
MRETWQRVGEYAEVRRRLKWAAIGSIVFGIIAIVMGVTTAGENPLNIGLAVIGGLLFAEGIWLLLTLRPVGLIVDGIMLCILGVWIIFISIYNMTQGSGGISPIFIPLGIFQIYWGVQN